MLNFRKKPQFYKNPKTKRNSDTDFLNHNVVKLYSPSLQLFETWIKNTVKTIILPSTK